MILIWAYDITTDPFVERVIAATAINRLITLNAGDGDTAVKICHEDIDKTSIFPEPVSDILFYLKQRYSYLPDHINLSDRGYHNLRDTPFWPGVAFQEPENNRPPATSIPASFKTQCLSFCPKLNCLQAECFLDRRSLTVSMQ